MTNAVIKSVLLMTPGGSSTPNVVLAKGASTGTYYAGEAGEQNLIYQGNMTYNGIAIDTLDADFPSDGQGSIAVTVTLNDEGTFTGIATKADGTALVDLIQTPNPVPAGTNVLTLTFKAPSAVGTTSGYSEMVFPTSVGYIDPNEEDEREPN